MSELKEVERAARLQELQQRLKENNREINALYPELDKIVSIFDQQVNHNLPEQNDVIGDIEIRAKHVFARIYRVMARINKKPDNMTEADVFINVPSIAALPPLRHDADDIAKLERRLKENDREINQIYYTLEAIIAKLEQILTATFQEDLKQYEHIDDEPTRLTALLNSVIAKMHFMEGEELKQRQQAEQNRKRLDKEQAEVARQNAEQIIANGSLEQIFQLPGLEIAGTWLQQYGNEAQHGFHDYTVGEHTRQVLTEARRLKTDLVTTLAAALHDVGKQGARESQKQGKDPQNRGREPDHAVESTNMVRQMLSQINWLDGAEKIESLN